jgi:hypothetical protein
VSEWLIDEMRAELAKVAPILASLERIRSGALN